MGFFGDDSTDEASIALDEQNKRDREELEQKRKSLTQERLNLIKSQGVAQWYSPDKPKANIEDTSSGSWFS